VVLHGNKRTLPLARWIFALKKQPIASTFASRLMHLLLLSRQKKSSCWGNFGIVVLLSHQRPFARLPPTKLAHIVSCPCWLRPLGLAVKRSLPAMSCALVGQDRWGLMYIS
jgi:hypothetical protein